MKLILIGAGSIVALVSLCFWLKSKLQYRIGSKQLKIQCFGVTLRTIDYADIKRISKRRPSRMTEDWSNTLKNSHRLLAIQRLSGIRKFVVISPRNRYIFLADLQNAIKRAKPETNLELLVENSPEAATEVAA
jgi:hypothetical protein